MVIETKQNYKASWFLICSFNFYLATFLAMHNKYYYQKTAIKKLVYNVNIKKLKSGTTDGEYAKAKANATCFEIQKSKQKMMEILSSGWNTWRKKRANVSIFQRAKQHENRSFGQTCPW